MNFYLFIVTEKCQCETLAKSTYKNINIMQTFNKNFMGYSSR